MKRFFIFFLVLVLFTGTAAAKGSDAAVQDPLNYMQGNMTFEGIGESKNGQQYRKFKGGSDSYDLITCYVNALCAQGNFKLYDSYYVDYGSDVFFSYALTYTGSAKVGSDKPEMNFKDNVYGDVAVYGAVDGSKCKGDIFIVKGLEFDDLGLRVDGTQASTESGGQSVSADLLRSKNGSYETSDGRFRVKVGQAMVYRDGDAYTTDAVLLRNKGKNREELQIYNFYRNESILLTVPYNSVLTGDVFDHRKIACKEDSHFDGYMESMEDFLGWTFSNQILGVCHDGDYQLCYRDGGNDFIDAAVRVLSWDTDRQEAVFYIYAAFDTAPYEYEAVAAVRMGDAQPAPTSSTGSDREDCWICGGDGRCNKCGGSGRVREWAGDQYMDVTCTGAFCWSGKCSSCGGKGYK